VHACTIWSGRLNTYGNAWPSVLYSSCQVVILVGTERICSLDVWFCWVSLVSDIKEGDA
jgi:hypothetical protein